MVRTDSRLIALVAGALTACASYPVPVQHMADAQAAARSAEDTGVNGDPQAQLHLKLAQEGIARAKQLVASGDNERADFVLVRAKSDAELAAAEAQGTVAERDAQKASQEVADLQARRTAQPTSITTTTSGTVPPPPTTTTTITTTTNSGGPK